MAALCPGDRPSSLLLPVVFGLPTVSRPHGRRPALPSHVPSLKLRQIIRGWDHAPVSLTAFNSCVSAAKLPPHYRAPGTQLSPQSTLREGGLQTVACRPQASNGREEEEGL